MRHIKNRTPIKRVGNKTCLLIEIHSLLPAKIKRYCEVFGGSGAVLFSKQKIGRELEVYNDFDRNLVNFMMVIRDRPYEFLYELLKWNDNSHEEYDIIKNVFHPSTMQNLWERKNARTYVDHVLQGKYVNRELAFCRKLFDDTDYQDIKQLLKGRSELYDVKRAAAFFRLIYYSFRSSGKSYGGQGGDLFSMVDVLLKCSRRLAKVRIQNMDFEKLILQYDHPDTVFYLDPPYYKTEKMYDVTFGEGDHQRLQKVLSSIQGRYLLSYNDSPYIRDLYSGPGLRIVGKKRPNTYSGVKDAIFEELFIMNYNPGADSMKPAQLSLEEIV